MRIIILFSAAEKLGSISGDGDVGVPKRRTSRSKKGMRRSHDFLVAPALNTCPQCKLAVPPHKVCHLVEECGNIQRSKAHKPTPRSKESV
jgi:large subunit ribosomal protein L32